MRLNIMPETWVLGALTAFYLAALVLLAGPDARAGEAVGAPSCSCPSAGEKASRPKFAEYSGRALDESDEIAALETVQIALSRMDDGDTVCMEAQQWPPIRHCPPHDFIPER